VTDLPLVHCRLQAAVERLTAGEGFPQERLQDACNQFLADLSTADFPPALRRRYRAFQRRIASPLTRPPRPQFERQRGHQRSPVLPS